MCQWSEVYYFGFWGVFGGKGLNMYKLGCIDFAEVWYIFFFVLQERHFRIVSFYELQLDLENTTCTMQGMREFSIHFDSSKL